MSHEYLAPQADRITTVATVVDAIAAGCDTVASIAAGLGMATRQGSYYPHAAAALGYVTQVADTTPVTWSLTLDGAAFAAADSSARAHDLVAKLSGLHELDLLTGAGGATELASTIAADGYSEQTTRRRLQTLQAWATFLALDHETQEDELTQATKSTAAFAPAAAAALAQTRRAQAAAATRTYGAVCESCFMAKSFDGTCDTCD